VLEKNDGADEICQHCGMTMVRVENDPGFLPFETGMFRGGDSFAEYCTLFAESPLDPLEKRVDA
jgi:hypothetical protein